MCVILAMESRFEGSSVFCELGHGGRCGRVVVVTRRVTTAFSQLESLDNHASSSRQRTYIFPFVFI